jgi:hypothetical protein
MLLVLCCRCCAAGAVQCSAVQCSAAPTHTAAAHVWTHRHATPRHATPPPHLLLQLIQGCRHARQVPVHCWARLQRAPPAAAPGVWGGAGCGC